MLRAAACGGGEERCRAEGLAAGTGSALVWVWEKAENYHLKLCRRLGGWKENQN